MWSIRTDTGLKITRCLGRTSWEDRYLPAEVKWRPLDFLWSKFMNLIGIAVKSCDIVKKGKVGSTKTTYKLTTFGEAKAKSLLKEILKNE